MTNKSQYGPRVLSNFIHFHLIVNCWERHSVKKNPSLPLHPEPSFPPIPPLKVVHCCFQRFGTYWRQTYIKKQNISEQMHGFQFHEGKENRYVSIRARLSSHIIQSPGQVNVLEIEEQPLLIRCRFFRGNSTEVIA